LLGLLLLPLEKLKHGKLIRTILLVLFLWLYALFTGLATPVLRATVMFSFLVIGRHFGRYTNTVNTLAASAFLMLLINPFSIADTGFQLSYLSVLGIIVIYPLLKELFEFRNFIGEKMWELTCLSASAQIAIAPLSLLYFHQFPNYFILTNLLIVPLLSIVIYSGVLFLTTAHIPFISIVTTWLLQKSLLLMNGLVGKAPHLPLFVTKGVSISIPEAMLLYLVLIYFFIFWLNKKHPSLFISLFCFTLFLGIRVWKDHTNSNQQIFAVYNIPKHSAIAFLSGKQSILFQPVDSLDFCYHIQCHWWDKGIIDSASLRKDTSAILLSNHLYIKHNLALFNKEQIAFIRNNENIPNTPQKVKVHYLVVSGDYKLNMAALQNAFIFDKLIFDSSVSPHRLKKWKEECEQLHIDYYDVNTQGAFIENC
jgi:competence protein ComEC